MLLFRRIARSPLYNCRRCIHSTHSTARQSKSQEWEGQDPTPEEAAVWNDRSRTIRAGFNKSVLTVLEERGYVKDVAGVGGRPGLDWLMTEKPIGAYVGVDPTAPSLHVGHLLPLMVLYWMHLFGFSTVTLLGGGTVHIGDPSGRNTSRERQDQDARTVYSKCINAQLGDLWKNVKALGVKHSFPTDVGRRKLTANNHKWLRNLSAIDLMRDLGSGMRLAGMLNRDSVKMRMESGAGMSFAEFSYPLFQGYDWWTLYDRYGVQLQIGGSDQHGNICAGIDAVKYMRADTQEPITPLYGITTPLLTTSSGEKFGKSAGNAVWLDKKMLSSFDLYQYFMRTADDDVERYLKLFTFLPLGDIKLIMLQQNKNPGKRTAQRVLAKEFVELAHGAHAAMLAERDHQDAFRQGTQSFPLRTLRKILNNNSTGYPVETEKSEKDIAEEESWENRVMKYKRPFMTAGSNATQSPTDTTKSITSNSTAEVSQKVVVIPKPLVEHRNFAAVLHAAGLVSTKAEGHRLIQNGGAYVACQSQGPLGNSPDLKWEHITPQNGAVPHQYVVDWEALVLRVGKSKIQVCRIVEEALFESQGLSCPGWEDFKILRTQRHYKDAEAPQ